ncbi:hypothetical protein LDO31_02865 [Luteimonas sp. XNQY3]|nr:hypothetical protein [Luteimonas sp. XNQY3]MCD9005188.1 hypothetical protein [Luteimonas sp. XNQY3]
MAARDFTRFEPNPDESVESVAGIITIWANERNLTGAQVRMIFEGGMLASRAFLPDLLFAEFSGEGG